MPMSSMISKEEVCKQYGLLGMLEIKCKRSKLFAKKEAEQTFIYSIFNPIPPKYSMMAAISKYGKKYAILTPEDLTEKELVIFEFVLREADPDDEFVVFSKRDYHAAKKYLYDKKNKVTLCS